MSDGQLIRAILFLAARIRHGHGNATVTGNGKQVHWLVSMDGNIPSLQRTECVLAGNLEKSDSLSPSISNADIRISNIHVGVSFFSGNLLGVRRVLVKLDYTGYRNRVPINDRVDI